MIRQAQFIIIAIVFMVCSAAWGSGEDGKSWAFSHPPDQFQSNALLDLRFLNETTAGQSGFVRASSDGGFIRGDGTPIRFWACGTQEFTKNSAELARHARFLAKIGVNMVRIHAEIGSDNDDSNINDTNENEIDGIWRAVAAFKKEGIYITISPYWANDRPAKGWGIEGYENRGDLWGLLFFNPKLQDAYKQWVRQLYARKNPYTGIPLADDPAVAIVQIQNEDGLFFWTVDAIKPPQKKLLASKFAQWLTAKYGSLHDAASAWNGVSAPGDDFANGDVGLMTVWEWTRPQHGGKGRRLADQLQFFAETQRHFYSGMVKFYREDLGCKQLINASNWITADAVRLNDVERFTDTAADVLAVNKYFTGIHQGPNIGWRIDPGDFFTDHPAVLNPPDLPTNLKQVTGYPMIITESTWVSPLDFQNEGPFLVAAYESLTGVAGYYWFTATAEQYDDDPRFPFLNEDGQHPFRKWTCSIPSLMGNFPAAALMYRNGYLKRGEPVVTEERSLNDLWNRRLPLIAEDKSFDPNRMSGDEGAPSEVQRGADPLAFLVGPVMVHYGGDGKNSQVSDLSRYIDRQKKIVTSNTGEIRLDYNIGLCTIDAPAAQGVSGFLQKAGDVHLSAIDISAANEQASILVVSMDTNPIEISHHLLVQVGTRARLSGWKQEPAQFEDSDKKMHDGMKITNIGQPPWMIDDTDVTLTIRNDHLSKAILLDSSGYPNREIPLTPTDGMMKLRLPHDAMYLVLQ